MKRIISILLSVLTCLSLVNFVGCSEKVSSDGLVISYSFNEDGGSTTKEKVSGKNVHIEYVFSKENQANIFKQSSDPLRKDGVSGNCLYMDGFSTYIKDKTFTTPTTAMTLSAWVAPRAFENLPNYGGSYAGGQPKLTSVINQGNIELCEGFLLGYGRLGMWGIQLALRNNDTAEDFVICFYDPINTLTLYEWSHIAVSYDGTSGYIALFFNGKLAYESLIPELQNTEIIESYDTMYIGYYTAPEIEFSVDRQILAGLLDEVRIYKKSLSPKNIKALYNEGCIDGVHPNLDFSQIALDSSVYEGDRYRPQYHAIPPATWMNEPHSPFYYNGKYHVFYQHNPTGPYWSQIRWAHIVSDDMIHWEYVKDAVVPTAGICPEGVWTGGACIGPDGTPWLAITAGTNTTTWSGQNVAFAHPADPTDPYLTDWVVEDKLVITHPSDDSQGEINQFRDPFVWFDDGVYYMMVSTSVPGRGGSANIYTSLDMREWEYKGYVFECDYGLYPEQGAHWECVVMFPIRTKDGSQTKYILFDCPQYTVDGYVVDCYYWIGTFDKTACRFIADDPKPKLFDCGNGIYTGQNGFTYLTEEDIAKGKTSYEDGRTVIYAIAQGKAAGTEHNKNAGWAHNFAIPLELSLADNGVDVIREPIVEMQSLREETLYTYSGTGKTASQLNEEISSVRGDLLEIDLKFSIAPSSSGYTAGLYVRYNPNVVNGDTERTLLAFGDTGVYINRDLSTLIPENVDVSPTRTWANPYNEYSVKILLDRCMLEMYVNGIMSFTTRIYPKYADSDYLCFFDDNANMTITEFTVRRLGSAYSDTVTPAYFGNTGNLADLI